MAALGVDVDALKRDVAALCRSCRCYRSGAEARPLDRRRQRVRDRDHCRRMAIRLTSTSASTTGAPAITVQMLRKGHTDPQHLALSRTSTSTSLVGSARQRLLTRRSTMATTSTTSASSTTTSAASGRPARATVGSRTRRADCRSLSDTFFPYYLYINAGVCARAT